MVYDFIIIGGGTAGLSAAMYAGRLNLKTLLFTEFPGGLITTAHIVENWPGITSIKGPELAMKLYEHAQKSGAEIKNEKVVSVGKKGDLFEIKSSSAVYQSKTVLFATGTEHRKLGIPSEKVFDGKGVSYCALCDGAFYKGKVVAIVGSGDTAAKEALLLSEYAKKVYLFARSDKLKAEPRNLDNVLKNTKIEVMYKTEIGEIIGGDKVTKVRLKDGKEVNVDGIFVAIGHTAQTALAKDFGAALNDKGEILVNRRAETSIPGAFAAGDCTDSEFKQAIIGSAEGVMAAFYAHKYINR